MMFVMMFIPLMVSLSPNLAMASEARNFHCQGFAVFNGHVAAPPSYRGNLTRACNLKTRECGEFEMRDGVLISSLRHAPEDPISVLSPSAPGACLIVPREASSGLRSVMPNAIAAVTGAVVALLGAWFNAFLSRVKEREVSISTWRSEMIQRAEQLERTGTEVIQLNFPIHADRIAFRKIMALKKRAEELKNDLPQDPSPADKSEVARKIAEMLSND